MESVKTKDRCEVGKMTIADGMHQIVDNINGARTVRAAEIEGLVHDVGEIRAGAQKDLKQVHRARMRESVAQHKALHAFAKTLNRDSMNMIGGFSASRMAMGRQCQEELADFTHQLKKDVNDIRLDSVHLIHGFADERVSRSIELSRMLRSYNEGIVDDVEQLMGIFKKDRIACQADLAEAHAIWMSGGAAYTKPQVHSEPKAPEVTTTPDEKEDAALKQKILKVIKASPNGITLAKAGKKIGVEWRKLIRPAKALVENGRITKKETQYFPC